MGLGGRDRHNVSHHPSLGSSSQGAPSVLLPRAPFSELDPPQQRPARLRLYLCRLHRAGRRRAQGIAPHCRAQPKWRGQVCILQVTDATANAIQLRAAVDARDASSPGTCAVKYARSSSSFCRRSIRTAFPGCAPSSRVFPLRMAIPLRSLFRENPRAVALRKWRGLSLGFPGRLHLTLSREGPVVYSPEKERAPLRLVLTAKNT